MVVVALTGGIASGKSTVANMLAQRGATCIDADDVARRVVEPGTPALAEITSAFGSGVLRQGHLDRAALAAIVFTDVDAREKLNSIVHPRVRELTSVLIAEAQKSNPHAIVVYAIPLLVETEADRTFDVVVAVSASEATRIQRLVDSRGMTRAQAKARVDAQASEHERLAAADVVIDTNGTLAQTESQVDELWRTLISWRPA